MQDGVRVVHRAQVSMLAGSGAVVWVQEAEREKKNLISIARQRGARSAAIYKHEAASVMHKHRLPLSSESLMGVLANGRVAKVPSNECAIFALVRG